jgi:hypothetical protein
MQAPNNTNGLPAGVYASYTPLVYPHPRVAAEDGGGSSANPMAAVTPLALDYGSIAVGSTKDLVFTVQNTGAGTLSGSASVAPPFSIISGSPYSLGPSQSQAVTVRYNPTASGDAAQNVTFLGADGATAPVSGTAWPILPGLSFDATAGMITFPFTSNADDTISQSVVTDDPASGGRAIYVFNVTNAGYYIVSASVSAPDDGANSFFLNIDAEPSPAMIWDIPVYAGFTNQSVYWRGDMPLVLGTPKPRHWLLDTGLHQLIVRGREMGTTLGRITILNTPPPVKNLR